MCSQSDERFLLSLLEKSSAKTNIVRIQVQATNISLKLLLGISVQNNCNSQDYCILLILLVQVTIQLDILNLMLVF